MLPISSTSVGAILLLIKDSVGVKLAICKMPSSDSNKRENLLSSSSSTIELDEVVVEDEVRGSEFFCC